VFLSNVPATRALRLRDPGDPGNRGDRHAGFRHLPRHQLLALASGARTMKMKVRPTTRETTRVQNSTTAPC